MEGRTKKDTVKKKPINLDDPQINLRNKGDIKDNTSMIFCRTCMIGDNLKDMMQTYYYKGKPEVYYEMLAYCFSIQYQMGCENQDLQYLICETCVCHLRDAYEYRHQVEKAQQTFQRMQGTKSPKILDYEELAIGTDCVFNNGLLDGEDLAPELVENTTSEVEKRSDYISIQTPKLRRETGSLTLKTEDLNDGNTALEKKSTKPRKREELPYKLEKNDLECKLCGESFPVHKLLQSHMNIHFPNHVCETCGKAFALQRQLWNHSTMHRVPSLPCNLCPPSSPRLFKTSGALSQHISLRHLNLQIYRCSTCNIRFGTFTERKKHMVTVHGEENMNYACKLCPKRFSLSTILAQHISRVHLQQRKHKCNVCDMAFHNKVALSRHMVKHTRERNFRCVECGKCYGHRYSLQVHMRNHTNDRKFVCYICDKAFTQKSILKEHVKAHMKMMPQEKRIN